MKCLNLRNSYKSIICFNEFMKLHTDIYVGLRPLFNEHYISLNNQSISIICTPFLGCLFFGSFSHSYHGTKFFPSIESEGDMERLSK